MLLMQILMIIAILLFLYGAIADTRRLRDADPLDVGLALLTLAAAIALDIF